MKLVERSQINNTNFHIFFLFNSLKLLTVATAMLADFAF